MPRNDEARIREHAAKLGFGPEAIEKLVRLLMVFTQLIPLFLARRPKKRAAMAAAAPEGMDAEAAAIERDFELAVSQEDAPGVAEPGRFGGPMTEALLAKAFRSLLDLAERNVDAAAALVDRLVNRFVRTP